tara:strand:- start:835 stop:1020 length:186 start_codon:yes stop_codon:yes gene_type:complete
MLTRKDYKAIAAIIQENTFLLWGGECRFLLRAALTHKLADYMAADNPNFDRDKFIKACYGN